ncbi:MAG: N-acetyltransferase [Clostridia bacterium]|nr:N-acetyltransferase [Clostridia bacterium]
MNKENITFRLEESNDYREVENLVRESFWNVYRPGCSEHYLINQLRNNADFVKELDIVMECNGKIIGQNVFVKAKITTKEGKDIPILTMGPICVSNELKRQGLGKILLDYSIEEATKLGYGAVFFEGNIDFYGKSGFTYGKDFNISYNGMPLSDAPFFLGKELIPGYLKDVSGIYHTPECYMVSDDEVEEFDNEFPYKEKLKLPGQLC